MYIEEEPCILSRRSRRTCASRRQMHQCNHQCAGGGRGGTCALPRPLNPKLWTLTLTLRPPAAFHCPLGSKNALDT